VKKNHTNTTVIDPSIKTLIWDLDGTLLDSFGVLAESLAAILPGHNKVMPTEAVLRANFHGSLEDTIDNSLGGIDPDKLHRIVQDFLAHQNMIYEVIEDHFYPDALALAGRAHAAGKTQIIVTNRGHINRLNASPRSIVERSKLKEYIDYVICGDDSEHRKPRSAVIETLLHEGIINPAETLVIGDQIVDAQFAQNLTARGLLISRDGDSRAMQEKLVSDNIQLVHIINSLDEVDLS